MSIQLTRWASALAFAFLLFASGSQAKTPLPNWNDQRVTGPAEYRTLASTIADVEGTSPRQYYVVVVENSGAGQWPTRDYAHDVYDQWTRQSPDFAGQTNVVIVLARQNRQLGIWGSPELQNRLGFKGQVIDREIVQPHFVRHAKAGKYVRGLERLIPAIEEWISRKEIRLESQRIATAERQARNLQELTRREQNFVLESLGYRRSLDEDPSLSDAQRQKLVGAYEAYISQFDLSQPQPAYAERLQRFENSHTDWLKLTQEATIIADSRARVFRHINPLREKQKDVLAKLAELDKQELPTGPAAYFLNPINEAIELTPERINADPVAASAMITEAKQAAERFDKWADYQPEAKTRIATSVIPELELSRHRLLRITNTRAKLGLETNSVITLSQRYEEALGMENKDLAKAEETYNSLITANNRLSNGPWAQEVKDHIFMTRTLPITIASLIAALVIGGLLWLWWRARAWRKQAERAYTGFNKPVVNLLDQLEDFRRRHELLPFTDPDFEAPMTGDTHALYEQLETRQESMRADWVTLMDMRRESEDLVNTKSMFSAKPYKQVMTLLGRKTGLGKVEATMKKSNADLKVLEAAHEEANVVQTLNTKKTGSLSHTLESIKSVSLSTAPYESDREACADAAEDAASSLQGDPLGAQVIYEAQNLRLDELVAWTEGTLKHHAAASSLRKRLDESRKDIDSKRAGGLMLIEEEGNPDPVWEQGDAEQGEAIIALDGGDVAVAEDHIASGEACVNEAQDRVARQIAARDFCRKDLPQRRREQERLSGLSSTTASHHAQLNQGFHPESFAAVSRNVESANSLLLRIPPIIEEADRSDEASVQRYFHAADLIHQVQNRQARIQDLLDGVSNRLEELENMQVDCQAHRRRLQVDLDRLTQTLTSHIRTASQETIAEHGRLQRMIKEADSGMAEARPHWPDNQLLLQQTEAENQRIQKQLDTEIAKRREFETGLTSVRELGQQTESFLRNHREDRAPANQLFQQTAAAVEQLGHSGTQDHAAWETLLSECHTHRKAFNRASAMAKEDIRLAEQAREAMREAQNRLAAAHNFHQYGVTANAGNAGVQIQSAESLFRSGRYEDSILSSQNAAQIAIHAWTVASAAANRIRRRREEERRVAERARRRRQQARRTSSSSLGSSSRSSGSSFRSSRSSSSSRSSGGSQTSW